MLASRSFLHNCSSFEIHHLVLKLIQLAEDKFEGIKIRCGVRILEGVRGHAM